MFSNFVRLSCFAFVVSGFAFGAGEIPECLSYGHPGHALEINNDEVLHWKRTTDNQFRERAHIKGNVTHIFADHNGHHHFEIQIGKYTDDTIEVIYNEDFGQIPDPALGMTVEACGDYITSTGKSGPYPPSPDGAIVHWVHFAPNPDRHPSGFLVMDGEVCGQDGSSRNIQDHRPTHPHGHGGRHGHGNHGGGNFSYPN